MVCITPRGTDMQVYQLDLFKSPEESRMDELEKSFAIVKESCNKVRKGQYAKIGELKKILIDMENRLSLIERNICRN